MPLEKSTTKDALARNIAELHRANTSKPQDNRRSNSQILAIAYAIQHESKKKK